MLMRTDDPFRDLGRPARQLMGPGTWSRPSAVATDAGCGGEEHVVAFDLPGVGPETIDIDVERTR